MQASAPLPPAVNPFLAPKHRPLIVGHRGVPALHQENTLAGFRRAVSLGVDAVELDVAVTADRRAVVIHDSNLFRLTGSARDVRDVTWDQLSRLRIRRELPMGIDVDRNPVIVRYEREERIPLLEDVLAEIPLPINVELKVDVMRWWDTSVGAVAAPVLEAAGATGRVIVTSFDIRKLRAAARLARALPVGFCFDDSLLDFAGPLLERVPQLRARLALPTDSHIGTTARRLLNRLLEAHVPGRLFGMRVVGAEHTLIGAETVRRLRAQNIAIGTHTLFPMGSTTGKPIAPSAMTEAEVHRLVALGVDWIETDDPERVLTILR